MDKSLLLDMNSNQDVAGQQKHDGVAVQSLVTLVLISSKQCIIVSFDEQP